MNTDDKLTDKILKEMDKEEGVVKQTISQFDEIREEGITEAIVQEKWKTGVELMMAQNSINDKEELEKAKDICLETLKNVREGKEHNLEINFIQKVQKNCGREQDLGVTVVKIVEANGGNEAYIYCDEQTSLEALIFISGEKGKAFLSIRNEKNVISFVELSEIHLLSISPNSKPGREVGLMTSYTWMSAKIYSSVILGENLLPIKNLLLIDAFPERTTKKSGEGEHVHE